MKQVRAIGGKGGDGAISFLQLWANENAGPDGGDGGNGGHVVFEVCVIVSYASIPLYSCIRYQLYLMKTLSSRLPHP